MKPDIESVRAEIEREILTHSKHFVLREGEPGQPVEVGFFEWSEFFGNNWPARLIADEHIGNVRVSTAFMGYGGILWESMVFASGEHSRLHNMCRRYCTRDAAQAGHLELVALVKSQV